jgi:hypothetical protein
MFIGLSNDVQQRNGIIESFQKARCARPPASNVSISGQLARFARAGGFAGSTLSLGRSTPAQEEQSNSQRELHALMKPFHTMGLYAVADFRTAEPTNGVPNGDMEFQNGWWLRSQEWCPIYVNGPESTGPRTTSELRRSMVSLF